MGRRMRPHGRYLYDALWVSDLDERVLSAFSRLRRVGAKDCCRYDRRTLGACLDPDGIKHQIECAQG